MVRATALLVMVNAGGWVHGGLAFLTVDAACAYGLKSIGPSGVAQNANMTYFSAVETGMTLLAVADSAQHRSESSVGWS